MPPNAYQTAQAQARPRNAYEQSFMPAGGAGGSKERRPTRANANEEFDVSQLSLDRLDKTMLLVSALGLIINIVQVYAISNHAWLRATAIADGQPYTAFLSLGSAKFGNTTNQGKDNGAFCSSYEAECSLRSLCSRSVPTDTYANGLVRFTPQAAWCDVLAAGSLATRFLFFGLLLGLGATGFTGLYSAQSIPWVADQFDKIEEMGFSDEHQKYIIAFGWGSLWIFVYASMVAYSMAVPDSLGWGTVTLEASFGLLRVCFIGCTVQCALVANSIFHLWSDHALSAAWDDFVKTEWLTFRKALYIELTLQLIGYFILVVQGMDWAAVLVVLAWIYLSPGSSHHGPEAYMIMYITFVIVSILFDAVEIIALPGFDEMTPAESFLTWTWVVVFAFKPIIVATMVAYEYVENQPGGANGDAYIEHTGGASSSQMYDNPGGGGVIYEDDEESWPIDERVAA